MLCAVPPFVIDSIAFVAVTFLSSLVLHFSPFLNKNDDAITMWFIFVFQTVVGGLYLDRHNNFDTHGLCHGNHHDSAN